MTEAHKSQITKITKNLHEKDDFEHIMFRIVEVKIGSKTKIFIISYVVSLLILEHLLISCNGDDKISFLNNQFWNIITRRKFGQR